MIFIIFNKKIKQKEVHRQDNTEKISKNKKELEKNLDEVRFSGTAILIKNGKIIDSYVQGDSDNKHNEKNVLSTSYEINSLQKVLTAGLVMEQVKAGRLKVDDKLSKFFPSISGADKISIRNLLDMTSGLTLKNLNLKGNSISSENLLSIIIHETKFNMKKLGIWNYQAVNFMILSEILEKVTHKTYEELFKKTYIDKLNLNNTEMAYKRNDTVKKSKGYFLKSNNGNLVKELQKPNGATVHSELGTGQVYMSASDFYFALASLLDGKLLGREATGILFNSNIENSASYYAGLYTSKDSLNKYANGYGYGFESHVRISKNGQNAVVIFSNERYVGSKDLTNAFNKIADEFLK